MFVTKVKLGGSVPPSAEDYFSQREEIKKFFSSEVFGSFPQGAEDGFSYEIIRQKTYKGILTEEIRATKGGFSAPFFLCRPQGKKNLPFLIYPILSSYRNEVDPFFPDRFTLLPSVTTTPISVLCDEGYGAVVFHVDDVQEDRADGRGLCDCFERTPNRGGALLAWSFFASRTVDYIVENGIADANRIGVCGHSRGGKTALLAGMNDERFSFVCSNNSGCCGAAIEKGKKGERISDIVRNFPYWFCENFYKYTEQPLLYDFDAFVSLIAPRKVYISSSLADRWADPRKEYQTCLSVGKAYEMYGQKGFCGQNPPRIGIPYTEGNPCYRVKRGKHSFDFSDWCAVLSYLNDIWKY